VTCATYGTRTEIKPFECNIEVASRLAPAV
jgi:hypothetical protein